MTCLGFIPGMPGGIELIILLLIILLLFGKRLPTAMFSVGKSITEFKKGMSTSIEESLDDDSEKSKSEKSSESSNS
ncbi:twin-arginine translocase TatA/TatE family subunit [Rubinisphaera sp.]|uniref:twin-arginine translocase TatA/TatE family subunit n=1 Tax=Rubinisphaera sp. TaxID=2024857 RepID=UPI0025DB09A3|nr:twin-arginine translocase TatA/TatE family subunit [Rubinisphaera sp.]